MTATIRARLVGAAILGVLAGCSSPTAQGTADAGAEPPGDGGLEGPIDLPGDDASGSETSTGDVGNDAPVTIAPTLVDCKFGAPEANSPKCKRDKAGGLGEGPALSSGVPGMPFGYGFLDGDRLIVALGKRFFSSAEPLQGVLATIDLRTGNRTFVSGTWQDPATGPVTAGKGPLFGDVGDVQKGEGGWYVFADRHAPPQDTPNRSIYRVDPATGDRTLVANLDEGPCTLVVGGRPDSYAGRMVVASSSTFFFPFVTTGPTYGIMKVAVAAGKATCSPLSASPASSPLQAGSGPTLEGLVAGLTLEGGSLYAIDTAAGALLKIDPATGARVRISSERDKIGSGQAPIRKSHLTIRKGKAYLFGVPSGANATRTSSPHTIVDLATGARTSTETSGDGPALDVGSANPVWAHPSWPFLILAQDDEILLFDPQTANRNYVSYR
jgi:hypothetical protein